MGTSLSESGSLAVQRQAAASQNRIVDLEQRVAELEKALAELKGDFDAARHPQ